jgi:hypothetical protein
MVSQLLGVRDNTTLPVKLPAGFDLGVALAWPSSKDLITGSERIPINLRHPVHVELDETERVSLTTALAWVYPQFVRAGKLQLAVGAEVLRSRMVEVIGERFGTVSSKRERSSFVAAYFGGRLLVGRCLQFIQFSLSLPKPLADEKKADKKSAAAHDVVHNWVQVRWFKPVSSSKAAADSVVPEFYLDDPYPDARYQWVPVQRIVCRVAPRITTRGEKRVVIACLLERKPSLRVAPSAV